MKSSLMLERSNSSVDDVSEAARTASVEMSSRAPALDPQVEPIARRRRFSGSQKRRLLAEAERSKAKGQLGALLRREGAGFADRGRDERGRVIVAEAELARTLG